MTLALVPSPDRPEGTLPGTVQGVAPGSLADRGGICPGDRILAIDGHALRDVIDYRFYSASERVSLEIGRAGQRRTLVVDKEPDESLGIDFGVSLFDDILRCNNNCYFCFVGGNRKEMRRSLFIKDDDYRLSFLFGNFVTLTNLTDEDWARLEEQRLSPLYVSVHATELHLRRRLLANRRAEDILAQLDRLAGMGIRTHCQLVICPGINDGEHLCRSIEDLAARHPSVQTVAAVPVGLTELNQVRGAFKLRRQDIRDQVCTPEYAQSILDLLRCYQRRYRKQFGTPLVYASDEYYLTAGERLPPARHYGEYPQLENGVGMVRWLLEDWRRVKRDLSVRRSSGGAGRLPPWITLACGTLIAPVLRPIVEDLSLLTGARVDLVTIENRTFGPSISCSGLLAGNDFLTGLASHDLGDLVVLPRYALDDAGEAFLDDLTPSDVEAALKKPTRYARAVSDLFGV